MQPTSTRCVRSSPLLTRPPYSPDVTLAPPAGPVYLEHRGGGRDSEGGLGLAWLSSRRAVCSALGPVYPCSRAGGCIAPPVGGFAPSGPEDVAGRDYYRPVGSHEIQHLLHEYGCLLVFVAVGSQAFGLPVPGTTALIAAALYAATAHGLPIIGVIAAGALGALAGTSAGFAVGRWGGEGVLLRVGGRLRQSPERVQQLRRQFACHGVAWLFVGRFISGVRNVTGLLAGASGMSMSRFLPVSTAAALTWALVNALEYYWFGHALLGASTWVQVVMVGAGIAWLVLSLNVLRRRTLRQLQRASSVTDLN